MVDTKVFKNSAIYTACNFLTKALNFILLPLYTAFLTTGDYGITGIIDNFRGVMCYLAIFSVQAAVMRFYIDYKDSEQALARYVGTLFFFSLLSTVGWSLLICALNPILMPLLFSGIDFAPTLIIALVGLAFSNVGMVYQQFLRGMENARLSAIFSIGNVLLTALLTIIFVVPLGMGANGVLLASCIDSIAFFLVALVHLRREGMIAFCIDWGILRDVLRYSIPLLPHNLSTNIAALVSAVLINGTGSLSAVGIYNLASKFGVVCDTLQSSVNTAYQPWLFRTLHEKVGNYKAEIVSFTETLLWVFAAVFVAVGLFIQEIILFALPASYAEAWPLVPLIVIVYSVKTVYYFYIGVLFYYKEAARFIFVATLSSSCLNVALSFPLIGLLGAYGSVLADGLSMVLRVGLVIWMSRKYEDVGYRIWQFARTTLVVFSVMAVGLVFSYTCFMYELSLLNLLWKLAVYGVFVAYICKTHKSGVEFVRSRLVAKFGKKG